MAAAFALVLPCAAVAAQGDPGPLRLSLKVGGEVDTNAERQEGALARQDVLTRYFLSAQHSAAVGQGQSLSLKWLSGGKFYQDTGPENALLNQVALSYQASALKSVDQDWLLLYARGQLKDRSEAGSRRDYLRSSATTGLGLRFGIFYVSAGAGYGLFSFKPNARLSNDGVMVEGSVSARWSDSLVSSLSVSSSSREYSSARFVQRGSGDVVAAPGQLREDEVRSYAFSTHYRGPVVLGASLTLLDIGSNSYGQSLQRYGATLLATTPLWWDVVLSARLGLLRTFFADRIFLIDDTLSVDEENRNTLVLELERPLSEAVSVSVSSSLYTQEFGASEVDYLRQLFFVGLGVDY